MLLFIQCIFPCFCVFGILSILFISTVLNYFVFCGPLILYALIKYYSLSKPDSSIVDRVLGPNPLYNLRNQKEAEISSRNLKSWSSEFDEHRKSNNCLVQTIGHRAYGFDAPENSISAIKMCHEKGSSAIEIDLMLTKDNVAITFHDSDLIRITGESGSLSEKTWDEIKNLNISKYHPLSDQFESETIPKFEDAVKTALDRNMILYLDIKEQNLMVVDAVLNLYKKYPELYEKSIICGFNPITSYLIRSQDPKIICGITWRPYYFSRKTYDPYNLVKDYGVRRYDGLLKHIGAVILDYIYDWALLNVCAHLTGAVAVLLPKDYTNPHEITKWERLGLRVVAWTVNLPVEKMHFARVLGVSYITDTMIGDI